MIRQLPWPIALTTLRLLLLPVFFYLLILAAPPRASLVPMYTHPYRQVALIVFGIMAITDALDGYLARKLNQVTRLGVFLDPTADKLLITGGLLLLCFPRFAPAGLFIPWQVLWGVFQKDICVLIGAAVVKHKRGRVEINANLAGKVNTTVEISVVIATLLAPEWIAISPTSAAIFLWTLWHLTVLATAWAGIAYSREGARQLRAPL